MTDQPKIDHDIPLPKSNAREDSMTDMMRRLQIGDSVLFGNRTPNQIRSLAYNLRFEGMRFTVRANPDGGTRIWRTV